MNFIKNNLEQLFWLVILVSWIPIVAGYSIFPNTFAIDTSNLISEIVIPEPRYFGYEVLNGLMVLFIICIPISIILRKRYVAQEKDKYLSANSSRIIPEKHLDIIKRERPQYLIAALPLLTAATIPAFANGVTLSLISPVLYVVYILSFLASVIVYLRNSHLISSAFVIFSIFLILDSILLFSSHLIQQMLGDETILNHYSVFGSIFSSYSTDILKVFVFVLSAALIRIIYLSYKDNLGFIKSKDKGTVKAHSISTFKLWYPMLVVFAFFTVLYQVTYSYKVEPTLVSHIMGCEGDQIPAEENDNFGPFDCSKDLLDEEGDRISIDEALLKVNERKLGALKDATDEKINGYEVAVVEGAHSTSDKVYSDLNETVPKRLPGTKTKSCGINIICLVENGIKSATNSAYVSVKNRQMRKLRSELREIENSVDENSSEASELMKEKIKATFHELEVMNGVAIESSSKSIKWLSKLLFIYSLIILIKTFMIVFSRISFARETTDFATFKNDHDAFTHGTITRKKQRITLPKSSKSVFYFCTQNDMVAIDGPPEDRFTPQRFTAFFTRLKNGQLAMNRVDPKKHDEDTKVIVSSPCELVEWNLKKHERVFFKFKDFVGMSEGVKIERRVSLSISTLILGQVIQYCAVGPGKIYFKTLSIPSIVSNGRGVSGLNSKKLVAWNVCSQFNIVAELTKKNTFLSTANLQPASPENDMVLFDTSNERERGKAAGILQFAKSFLLPI